MSARFAVAAGLTGIALFAAGWWVGARRVVSSDDQLDSAMQQRGATSIEQLEESIRDKDRQVAELEGHLASAMRGLEEQGQIIREHSLTTTVRSVDELLALFPSKFPKGDWTPAEGEFEDCWFEAVDGLRIHGWYLGHDRPKVVILYCHGNAGNVTHRATVATYLKTRFDASILLFDYRGYGRSEGTPTVEGLARDARAARDYLALRERVGASDIVLMGRSLGGAVAVELAASDGARGLVLESTFSSLQQVAVSHYPELLVRFLVANRLDSQTAISRFHGPVLVSHGSADQTIPMALGRELFEAANEPKTFVEIANGDHNDPQSKEYYDHLARFLGELPNR